MDNGTAQDGSTTDSRKVKPASNILKKVRQIWLRHRDEHKYEKVDPTPVFIPESAHFPLSLHEEMRRFMQSEFRNMQMSKEFESFEEADDFDIDDEEGDITSPYTVVELYPESGIKDDLEGDPNIEIPENSQKVKDTDSGNQENAVPPSNEAVNV